jgi:hypothetical protein
MRRLIPRKKAGKFKPQRQNNQLIVALETEEHRGCTQAFFSIASWKEGFTDESHLYKKCGRHGEDAEFIDNDEEQFKKVFNFMRKHTEYIMQMLVPQVKIWILALDSLQAVLTLLPIKKVPS